MRSDGVGRYGYSLAARPSPRNLDHGFTYFPHNPIPCPISDAAAAEDVNNNNTAPATMVGTVAIDGR